MKSDAVLYLESRILGFQPVEGQFKISCFAIFPSSSILFAKLELSFHSFAKHHLYLCRTVSAPPLLPETPPRPPALKHHGPSSHLHRRPSFQRRQAARPASKCLADRRAASQNRLGQPLSKEIQGTPFTLMPPSLHASVLRPLITITLTSHVSRYVSILPTFSAWGIPR